MVRPSSRGGVPVFRRVHCRPRVRSWSPRSWTAPRRCGRSYSVLADVRQPFRKVPVVTITAPAAIDAPVAQQHAGHAAASSRRNAATSACLIRRFGSRSSTSRMRTRYCFLSICARGDQTAGPRDVFKQAELDADGVGDFAHDAAERVDLPHQVTLGDAADGRVAGHLRDQVEIHGDHRGPEAHAGAGPGGLAPGVAGADHDDVVACRALLPL